MADLSRPRRPRRAALLPALPAAAVLAAFVAAGAPAVAHAQDALLARSLAATCANCHGTHGIARGEMKTLAGMPADEMLRKLADFRSGAQPATIMHQIVKGYTDDQLRLVAGHFAALPAKR